MSIGWIKLHRSLKDWEWYNDIKATRLLTHLLISVNYEDKKWMGQTIKAGSLAYSWENLSLEIGLTIQQTRTAMNKLERSGEVTRKSTNKYQVVTLCKWDKLQDTNKQLTDKPTSKQQTDNKQITTTKEVKEIKEEKKEENKPTAFNFRNSFLELGVENNILNDWLAVRKKKRSVNSETAFNLFVNEVKKSKLTIQQAVEMCAGRSWASYKVEYDKGNEIINKPTTQVTARCDWN